MKKLIVFLQYGTIEIGVASIGDAWRKVETYKKDGLSVTGYEITNW